MKTHSIQFLIVALAALLFSPVSLALTVQASVSKNKVAQNEVFQLRIVADERVTSDAIDFEVLNQDFYLSQPSFGTSISSVNGTRTMRSEWNISLASDKLGIARIPAFSIQGKKTQPIAIQVVKADQAIASKDLVDLQVDIDNRTLYPSESALLTLRLVVKSSPRRMRNPRIFPPKVADGIEMESLHNGKQYDAVIDGVTASVVEYQFRLTADKPGNYTLQGPSFSGSVIQEDLTTGATRLIPINISPKTYTIKVENKPAGYQGIWLPTPKLALNQTWQDSSNQAIDATQTYATHVGESISRIITLDIQGLEAERFPDLKVDYPASIRVYQEKPQFEALDDNTTRMTIKQVLIPQVTGEITLPEVNLNWWNSQTRSQQNATLGQLSLSVAPATNVNAAPVAPSLPSVAAPVQTVTVKDPGYWPYLTLLFAVLWLVTGVWAFAGRKHRKLAPRNAPASVETTWDKLLRACEHSDVIQIQHYWGLWLNEHPQLASQHLAAIEQQLTLMNQSQFANSQAQWQNGPLIALLKKARKSLKKETIKSPNLAKL